MNKKVLLISGVLLTFSIIIAILFTNNDKNIQSNIAENNTNEINNDMLTLMYETGIDTNEYEESTSNTWPDDNYIFNKELSGCENGGELSWNQQTNKITLLNNTSDRCYIYFDVYNKAVINNVTSSVTTNSITVNVSAIVGENPISKYYYSINNGEYIESVYNSYTFSNLDIDTTYNIKICVEDTLGIMSTIYSVDIKTDTAYTLANYIIENIYTGVDGVNGLYYHDGQGSYTNVDQEARDNSYRYAGSNPNNYVCFGSEAMPCPSDNLYRIIGMFDDDNDKLYNVKLIKADYANSNLLGTDGTYNSRNIFNASDYNTYKGNLITINRYYWNNNTNNNTWSQSNLNTTNLKTTFWNSISSTWQEKIATVNWYVNGYNSNATSAVWHDAESTGTTWTGKIGIMYVSDYGFAASPSYWTTNMSSYSSARDNNWMFMGLNEWTISRNSSNTHYVYYVYTNGYVYDNGIVFMGSFAVRPCFYLTSDVTYAGGTGTESDPYIIN